MSCEQCLSGVVLQPHQREVCDFFTLHKCLLCYHETGTGKTITALASVCAYLSHHPTDFAWIICPSTLESQWRSKVLQYLLPVVAGRVRVLSHEKFLKDIEPCWDETTTPSVFVESRYANRTSCPPGIKEIMGKVFLVVDESHLLCQKIQFNEYGLCREGKKSLALRYASSFLCSKLLLLTATPIRNHFQDLIPPLECLMIVEDPGNDLYLKTALSKDKKKSAFVQSQPVSMMIEEPPRQTRQRVVRPMTGKDFTDHRSVVFEKMTNKIHYVDRHQDDPCYPRLEYHDIVIDVDPTSEYYQAYAEYVRNGYLNARVTLEKQQVKKKVDKYRLYQKKNKLSELSPSERRDLATAVQFYQSDPHRNVNTNLYDGQRLNEFCIYHISLPTLDSTFDQQLPAKKGAKDKEKKITMSWTGPLVRGTRHTHGMLGSRKPALQLQGVFQTPRKKHGPVSFYQTLGIPYLFSPKMDFLLGRTEGYTYRDVSPAPGSKAYDPPTILHLPLSKSILYVTNTNTLIPILYEVLAKVYPTLRIFIICGNPKVIEGKTFKREDQMIGFNATPTNAVMILTAAGAQGVDLKGTDNIVFLERPFSYTDIRQIIGRGQRLYSHQHLPKKRQTVRVFDFFLKDPLHHFLFGSDLMAPIINKKKQEQEAFEHDLRRSCGLKVIPDQYRRYMLDLSPQQHATGIVNNDCTRFKKYQRVQHKTPPLQSKLFGFLGTIPLDPPR